MNPLNHLSQFNQSIWLDYIKRDLITSGTLQKFISQDNLRGITSNPSLFEKAIAEGEEYDDDIVALSKQGKNIATIYETLTIKDVRDAADEFRAVYQQTSAFDGYVSLEVNPHLAHDTAGTIDEARRLWKSLNRPNVMIKVPATKEGLPVITQLISEGINVNVTLLFSLERHKQVAEAYVAGIEQRIQQGKDISEVHSVASFFLSRIDSAVDPLLEKFANENLQGETAIASAKLAYQIYQEIFNSERFKNLLGANPQRLLWASTSAKNPNFSDVKYVEALIGPATVNTLPLETLNAYRDHGNPAARLQENVNEAAMVLQNLQKLNIDLDQITDELEVDGLDKFNKAYDQLIKTLEKKAAATKVS